MGGEVKVMGGRVDMVEKGRQWVKGHENNGPEKSFGIPGEKTRV